MMSYHLTTGAQHDIDAIAEYVAIEATVERALKILSELRDAFRKLAEMPGIGHFREDLLSRHYKFWSVHSYVTKQPCWLKQSKSCAYPLSRNILWAISCREING
jgi:plasmid stabilization system protein ParE